MIAESKRMAFGSTDGIARRIARYGAALVVIVFVLMTSCSSEPPTGPVEVTPPTGRVVPQNAAPPPATTCTKDSDCCPFGGKGGVIVNCLKGSCTVQGSDDTCPAGQRTVSGNCTPAPCGYGADAVCTGLGGTCSPDINNGGGDPGAFCEGIGVKGQEAALAAICAEQPEFAPETATTGQTATIIVTGSTTNGTVASLILGTDKYNWNPLSLPMPCSQTACLRERYFTIGVNSTIAYRDANNQQQFYNFRSWQNVQTGSFGGNDFSFTFRVLVPGATSINGVSAGAIVHPLVAYGIHGWFKFTYTGTGSAGIPVVTVPTHRVGQEVVVPGATSLLPINENIPAPQDPPAPPPVTPAPGCFFTYALTGGSGLLGLLSRTTTFDYEDAVSGCNAGGGIITTSSEILAASIALPGPCVWTATPAVGGRVTVTPGGSTQTKSESSSCAVVCKIPGCL